MYSKAEARAGARRAPSERPGDHRSLDDETDEGQRENRRSISAGYRSEDLEAIEGLDGVAENGERHRREQEQHTQDALRDRARLVAAIIDSDPKGDDAQTRIERPDPQNRYAHILEEAIVDLGGRGEAYEQEKDAHGER